MSQSEEPAAEAAPSTRTAWELPTARSIRLLKITNVIPATEETNEDSIFYLVSVFELDDCPPFIALSYTWSSPLRPDIQSTEPGPPAEDLSVDTIFGDYRLDSTTGLAARRENGEVDALEPRRSRHGTKNLRDALVQFHQLGLDEHYFWADAVCIDQDNLKEKEQQVAMMDDIYSAAQVVVVWLGPEDSDLESWLWVHETLLDALVKWVGAHSFEELSNQKPFDPVFLSQLGVLPPGGNWRHCWEAYFRFYRRRTWFVRAWVVQEATLARQIVVHCGSRHVGWHRLVGIGDLLSVLGWQMTVAPDVSRGFGRAMADEIIRFSTIKQLLGEEIARQQSLRGYSDTERERRNWFAYFTKLLQNTRVNAASDARDKIYATLGIAKRVIPTGMLMPIQPDYSDACTARSLYSSVAVMLLQECPRLELLSLVQDHTITRISTLPSWVPDWTCQLTGLPLRSLRSGESHFACDGQTQSLTASELFQVDKDRLVLQGIPFDQITEVSIPMWDILRTHVIDELLGLCAHVNERYLVTDASATDVLWRTMIANSFDGQPALPAMAQCFRIWATFRLATASIKHHVDKSGEDGNAWPSAFVLDEDSLRTRFAVLDQLEACEAGSGSTAGTTVTDPELIAPRVLPTVEEVLVVCRLMHQHTLLRLVRNRTNIVIQNSGVLLSALAEELMKLEEPSFDFQKALARSIPYRRLYRTAQGYLGLGPASAEIGDQVWMIRGADVPFVLRCVDDTEHIFKLVGETYVHGCMHGEMAVGGILQEAILQ